MPRFVRPREIFPLGLIPPKLIRVELSCRKGTRPAQQHLPAAIPSPRRVLSFHGIGRSCVL
jgi:hypothetical protein